MITYKEKLVKFVKLKRAHIKKFGFVYADHKDYKDIRSWSEERCQWVYNAIVDEIKSYDRAKGLTDLTCPWCVYNERKDNQCLSCSYGKRHGQCLKKNSLYEKYATEEVRRSLTNKVYQDMINKINLKCELLRPAGRL